MKSEKSNNFKTKNLGNLQSQETRLMSPLTHW